MEQQLDVLLVDDDVLNRDGIRLYLQQHGFRVYEAGDAHSGWQAVVEHRPHVAVVDIVLPAGPRISVQHHRSIGVSLARRIKENRPQMGIVLFSAHEDRGSRVWDLLHEGHAGIVYTLKGRPPERLLRGIRDAYAGRVVLDPAVMRTPHSLADEFVQQLGAVERPWVERAAQKMERLTPRERDVVNRIAASYNVEGIAEYLGISSKTVENHTTTVYNKLGLGNLDTEAPALRKTVILAKACVLHDLRREQ